MVPNCACCDAGSPWVVYLSFPLHHNSLVPLATINSTGSLEQLSFGCTTPVVHGVGDSVSVVFANLLFVLMRLASLAAHYRAV